MNVQSPIRGINSSAPRAKSRAGGSGRRALLIAFVLCLLAGAGAYWYLGRGSDSAPPAIATATRGDIEDVVTAVGNLTPLTSVDVGAQVSGQLTKLYVQIGDD